MAASTTAAERLAVTEERVERIQDDVVAVNRKLDSHATQSYDNHEKMKKDLSAFKDEVKKDVGGLREEMHIMTASVRELITEIKRPSGLTALLVEVWRNPVRAGQMLILLATLGSIVAGFGAWLRGGDVPTVPSIPDFSAVVAPANGADLKDDKHPIDSVILPTTFPTPPVFAGDTDVP